ncbi:hypothetical protein HJC23_008774 [Cyclotella cryptica]|uniref:Uncharacterized protein n=1 Tax=Cyclotella cryptica TaxID=29204 RepID=A0ABD3PF16_9STRA|eukprot:CCRYP_015687-RA/>CCRYP_015687-RA protein AED:0.00 eAED:0.00 QI:0/-1/0/1/-1/1/1/0/249
MTGNLRQRRGKKASNGPATHEDETPSKAQEESRTPMEQLRDAQARLIVSRDRTADLHAAWRNQMFRMSIIIIFVTLHQFQKPIQSCIGDIKASNDAVGVSTEEGSPDKQRISGMEAIGILFGYAFYELLAVATAFLIAYLLLANNTSSLELNSTPYFLSSALVPIQLGFYFHSKQPSSCVGEGAEDVQRNFPVVVIYHTIVTIAAWFMKSGMEQCEEHVKLVTDSIADFERMDKKLKQKKQLKAATKKK